MNRKLPNIILEYIKDMDSTKDTIGCSEAKIYHFTKIDKELFLKIEKSNLEFEHERKMMYWLKGKLPVPEIVAQCKENGYDYLLMTKAVGEMACSEGNLNNPKTLVILLAEGIKMLQRVDISDCPFNCSLEYKLSIAGERIKNSQVDINDWEEDNPFNSPEELYDYLIANQPEEEIVFSHGDYCLPNVFFNDGNVTGFIDLGRAGMADKWQDIALCVRSLEHNLQNNKYTDLLFKYLGIEPDYEKIKYYILLDELF
ncbi:MAG: aphA [Clostridiales bacterium]|jgi:kanamycin kinase/aminoglycoside 3'-phosphotransferase-3|nr:aphA [Clostridiales bacterium]